MTRARATAALAGVFALAACAQVPTAPAPLETDWVTKVDPAEIPTFQRSSSLGYNPGELAAVKVENFGCEGDFDGSAFAIDEFTVISNWHVVENHDFLTLRAIDDGYSHVITEGTRIATNADLSLITSPEPFTYYATLADTDPEIGDTVYVVGFPGGGSLTTTVGRIVAQQDDTLGDTAFVFESSAATKPGSSGSAVYNVDWEVVGVVYAGTIDEGGTEVFVDRSFIVPVSLLHDFLEQDKLGVVDLAQC